MQYWDDYNKAEEKALNAEVAELAKEAGVPVATNKLRGETKMNKEYFYQITMLTKTEKKLYLSMVEGDPTWSFNPHTACYWNDEDTAEQFAKNWFKNFKAYKVEEVGIDIISGEIHHSEPKATIRALIQNSNGGHTTTHFTSRKAMNKWEGEQFKAADRGETYYIIVRERDLEPGEYTGKDIKA